MSEVIIPTKFFPAAEIVAVFDAVFVNLKLPESMEVSLVASSRTTSAEKVETPTALSTDATSSNPNVSTLVNTLLALTPLIVKPSSLINFPDTSDILTVFPLADKLLTYPTAPLLLPCILSPVDKEVSAVPTLTLVKVFISNKRSSY